MKKTLVVLLCLFFFCGFLCAEIDDNSKTYNLTAFKGNTEAGNPRLSVDFRLIDAHDNTVINNMEINIPQEYRQIKYTAFSWIVHGNAYGQVVLTFSFGQMKNSFVNESEANLNKTIKYKVELKHESTRVGNASIACYDRLLNSTEKANLQHGTSILYEYGNSTYNMYYADYYVLPAETVVNSVNPTSISLTYDFSRNTVAANFPPSQSVNVCNYWNRYGKAIIYLDIPSSASGYASGNYQADVTLTITPTS